MNLNSQAMADLGLIVADAYNHVVPQFIGEQKNQLLAFLLTLSNNTSYYLTFTPEGLGNTVDNVFSFETKREFVFRFTSAFLARFGDAHAQYKSLIDTITWSFALTECENTEYLAIPKELSDRLPSSSQIRELLSNNKWLVAYSALWLYLRLDPGKVPGQPSGRSGAAALA